MVGFVQETVDSDLDDPDPGPSTSKPPTSTPSPKKASKQKPVESDDEDTKGPSQVTKSQPSPQRPKGKKVTGVEDVSGNVSDPYLVI